MMRAKRLLWALLLISWEGYSEEGGRKSEKGKLFTIFENQSTVIKNPFELRDPFRRKSFQNTSKLGFSENFSYDNLPDFEDLPIDQIRITGIVLGPKRRATAASKDGRITFVLKEGMVLGSGGQEVKAIVPGGVVLVEKIKNVYDQEEFLETIIPISN